MNGNHINNTPGDGRDIQNDIKVNRIKPIHNHSLYHLAKNEENFIENPYKSLQKRTDDTINESPLNYHMLKSSQFPLTQPILEPWLREGSLGFIFGRRGSGKTWFTWAMALTIGQGKNFGPWNCSIPWRILYVDGEMRLSSMQKRGKLITEADIDGLYILSRERLINDSKFVLNLCDPIQQNSLLEYCIKNSIKILILDNLSCLFRGMRENDADSWDQVCDWLLDLKFADITVIIVHHSNREGNDMRGTSRREDAADWIIKVTPNYKFADIDKGTAFTTEFTKSRDDEGIHERPTDWTFITENNHININWKSVDTKARICDLIRSGIDSNGDIAQELNISPAAVSKHVKKLIIDGIIKQEGRTYSLS